MDQECYCSRPLCGWSSNVIVATCPRCGAATSFWATDLDDDDDPEEA